MTTAEGAEWSEWRHKEDDRLYEVYGQPMEKDHWGELVAIGADGTVILGAGRPTEKVFQEAMDRFGSGNFALTRIGERVLGRRL